MGKADAILAKHAKLTKYNAVKASGMTRVVHDADWVSNNSYVFCLSRFANAWTLTKTTWLLIRGWDRGVSVRCHAQYYSKDYIHWSVECQSSARPDVVALNIQAMPMLLHGFPKRYDGELHFETHDGVHVTASIHVIGEVCHHRHGDYSQMYTLNGWCINALPQHTK